MADRWAAEQRYAWIKESVEIFGQIKRENIMQKFSISLPQASADIAKVCARWPKLMAYNKSTKRYERVGPAPITRATGSQDAPQ